MIDDTQDLVPEFDICARCDDRPQQVGNEPFCAECAEAEQEAAWEREHERDYAAYYGGSSPQSIAEQYEEAWKVKQGR